MIDSILGTTPCDCGRCRPVSTGRVVIDVAFHESLLEELQGRTPILVGDANTISACGSTLARKLNGAGVRTWTVDLAPDGRTIHADDAILESVKKQFLELPAGAVPVAVGSGTVNDLVKAASHDLGRAYIVVATAPSMNGYTSAIASITVQGIKRTLASSAPMSVYADPAVLARSPQRMALAGLADLLSKPVSTADWKLDHLLWGEPYCPRPAILAGRAVERAVYLADEIGGGNVEGRLALLEALLISGISMAVAGTSSPASGGEHLISHFLDMTAACEPGGPRQPALHGEQVGLATRFTHNLWLQVLGLDSGAVDWRRAERLAVDADGMRRILDDAGWLPPDLRELLVRESTGKLERIGGPAERTKRIRERWDDLREQLVPVLEPGERYLEVLPAVGAPRSPGELGIRPEIFENACRMARWVRDRYTILDLVGDLGLTGI